MKSILAIGECMMELTEHSESLLKRAFAGDTYNALVYAKHYNANIDCQFFTAVGDDATSGAMRKAWQKQCINDQAVLTIDTATVGIYAIATDDAGERSFSYWRKDSAAAHMMRVVAVEALVSRIGSVDIVFFSGISLGILADEDKHLMMQLIQALRQKGALVAFDPNYRQAMWQSVSHAKTWFDIAYQHCDIALPGIEEHDVLYGQQTAIEVMLHCQSLGAKEIIVKSGLDGTYAYECGELIAHQPFDPAPIQVDSTAAGDSFAGTYLASRSCEHDIETALGEACLVAREVVQHKGAILAADIYQEIKTAQQNLLTQ
ncbi:sugar kinase [uncultured Shewanella sp.]|uniref:sugar kinase n=1 Tax=uncultured Shewanella sp. TaxID=173975 RepID=UPI0026229BFB|nr:sugar kinase [uncultured Shewanella sp.]